VRKFDGRDVPSQAAECIEDKRCQVKKQQERASGGRTRSERVPCRCVIDEDLANRLAATRAQTGLSVAEQIRRGIKMWLDAREWPIASAKRELKP